MKPVPEARGYGIGQSLAPALTTLVLAILSAVPIQIPGYAAVAPDFLLMSLYHWTLYRPDQLNYLAIFAIGLFFDLLTTAPGAALGITSLILLIARWAVLSSRRVFAGKSFPYVWGGFAVLAICVGTAFWGGNMVFNGRLLEPRGFLFQAVLTVAFYPLITLVFARIQRATAPTY